jgi:signal transduction histidine kinase
VSTQAAGLGRRLLPRSIASRLYLILFAGLLMAYGLSFAVLFYERYESAKSAMLGNLEQDIATSVAILDRLPAQERPQWLARLDRGTYRYVLGAGQAGGPLVSERARAITALVGKTLGTGYPVHGNTTSLTPERLQIHLRFHDGASLTIEVTPAAMPVAPWLPFAFVLQMGVLLLCTWLVVRLALRPLAYLARAAEAMTPAVDAPRLEENGPTEVANAAVAFNAMQDRISHYLQERLHLLASISHDLQTPITRMRLRADALDDSIERTKLIDDLGEMEHLVREGVAYARSVHGASEVPQRIDPDAFLESLVFDYQDIGKPVTLTGRMHGTAMVRTHALRRVLGNLIDNAIKYGGSAQVSAIRDPGGALRIAVADRGPGIPAAELERVLQPFYRLEGSRNRDTGGAGLGLAIASQLITSIGGSLTLENRDGNGLQATIVLP